MTMDRLYTAFRASLTRLPVFVLLAALVFASGSQYMHAFWGALGLPLMDTGGNVYDTMLQGYAGLLLAAAPLFHPAFNPVTAVIVISAIISLAWILDRRLDAWLITRGRRRRRAGIPRSQRAARAYGRFLRFEKAYGRFANVSLPSLGMVIAYFSFFLIAAVPFTFAEAKGTESAEQRLLMAREDLQALHDHLADVSVVSYRPSAGSELQTGVPLRCNSERCALMTAQGPIAVAKDRIVDEFVQRADLPDTCYTPEGIRRRTVH